MNLLVHLGGHQCLWHLRDGASVIEWLMECPWLNRGGALLLRVGAQGALVARALQREILAQDGGRSEVCPHVVVAAGGQALPDLIGAELGIQAGLPRRAFVRLLAQVLWVKPRVFVVVLPPPGASIRADLFDSAQELLEDLRRLAPIPALTMLFLDPRAASFGLEAPDLSTGAPVLDVLRQGAGNALARWGAYLHARLAWEGAGDLSLLQRWNEDGMAKLPVGADDELEAALSRHARTSWTSLPPETRQMMRSYLSTVSRGACPAGADPLALIDRRCLWHPLALAGPRPVPWIARAMLLELSLGGAEEELLRGMLRCVPLAQEVLLRCLDMESHVRALHAPACARIAVPAAAAERYARFQDQDPLAPESMDYPQKTPARPTGPWAFATMGEFLSSVPRGRHTPLLHEIESQQVV
jgi:hypothetical protein